MATTPRAPFWLQAIAVDLPIEPSVTTILPSTLAASISAGVPRPTQTSSAVTSVLALPAASMDDVVLDGRDLLQAGLDLPELALDGVPGLAAGILDQLDVGEAVAA